MDGFLQQVASHTYAKYGVGLDNRIIVFVSRRAQIYFASALQTVAPSANPSYTTIDKLFGSTSELKAADKLTLITSLYHIYSKYLGEGDFEKFYSFGELLLSDFDTIDRYVVDARKLYSDLSDSKDMDMGGDEAQVAAIEFWRSFRSSKAAQYEQHKFVKIWHSLYDIYTEFRAELISKGIAYQGMIYRDVAQNVERLRASQYIFVGLNALSVSEAKVLTYLQSEGEVDFYWDYSYDWIKSGAEAAYFIEKNLKKFPQAAGFESQYDVNADVALKVVDTPSEILQCQVVTSELRSLDVVDERTAVILTDENLLEPLLYAIDESIDKVNISMGYPIRLTLGFQFVELLISLQRGVVDGKFYHTDVQNLLRHPYLGMVERAVEIESSQSFRIEPSVVDGDGVLWRTAGNRFELFDYLMASMAFIKPSVGSELELHAMEIIEEAVAGFNGALLGCGVEVSTALYVKLLMQQISAQSIDFEGFSGSGMQVMGILESRSIDFDNVIMLSVSDDNFPSAQPSPSYIPITLRQGFGMPSLAEHSAIWSYYFFRLLQRAKTVTMVYCSAANDATSGEASRYIYQLKYCLPYQLTTQSLSLDTVKSSIQKPIIVENRLEIPKTKKFSPSAISRYIDCPLRFYFHDVASIYERDVEDEGLSALDVGNALHNILEAFYKAPGCELDAAVEDYFSRKLGAKISLNPGMALILRRAVERMVKGVVDYDRGSNFKVIATEMPFELLMGEFRLGGIIDRVDAMDDGTIRVVDYKSGSDKVKFKSIAQLFGDDALGHNHAALQLLIYCLAISKSYSASITAALYTARTMGNPQFSPSLNYDNGPIDVVTTEMLLDVEQNLKDTITKIYSAPFTQTLNIKKCTYCPYRVICRR